MVLTVGAAVTLTPTQTKKRSPAVIVMFALVVVVKVYFVSVVVRAVAPVAVPSKVPAALFRFNYARGKIVPELAVFLIQSAKVIVEPAGIVPAAFGTPL